MNKIIIAFCLLGATWLVANAVGQSSPGSSVATPSSKIEPAAFITPPRPQCEDVPVKYKRPKAWQEPEPPPAEPAPTVAEAKPQKSSAAVESVAKPSPTAANDSLSAPSAAPPAPLAQKAKKAPSAGAVGSSASAGVPVKAGGGAGAKPAKLSAATESEQAPAAEAKDRKAARAAKIPSHPQKSDEFSSEPTTKYLSADDSNSMASPAIVRRLIRTRRYVHPDYVRTYEFLNYYTFAYPPPREAEIAIVPEMRPADAASEYTLQIGVRALDRDRTEMRPLNLVVLLDVSGSMAGEPFARATSFIKKLVRHLVPGERLSVVTVSRGAKVILESHTIGAESAAAVDTALATLTPTDITNLEAGIARAYELASKTYNAKYSNRVIMVSDGAANAGNTSLKTIAKYAEDSDRQGIYLAGIAVGDAMDDKLMNALTDKGRGAYVFVDSEAEIDRMLDDRRFVAIFDVAVKDVRLKLVLPAGWRVKEFHGEQMSSVAAEVVPQYLSPNAPMLYHLVVATNVTPAQVSEARFTLEAEYRPVGGAAKKLEVTMSGNDLLLGRAGLVKGDALVRYAETLKRIRYPLEKFRDDNTKAIDEGLAYVGRIYDGMQDPELGDVIALMKAYRRTIVEGEAAMLACDRTIVSPPVVLGIRPQQVAEVVVRADHPERSVQAIERLRDSTRLLPLEGARMLALATGPVVTANPSGSSALSERPAVDPQPAYNGLKRIPQPSNEPVYDVSQVTLKLKAPPQAKSFSFAFNYFSAEYPEYLGSSYNDTFYALLQAASTNKGKTTNISFDPKNESVEVNNNYFEAPFHPIPNTGTGFDNDGSTGWLRTSWPIQGGESFTLTFSIHDEGDGVVDSLVLIDNFEFHDYPAVGNTDPLN